MSELHTVIGAGQVGVPLARILAEAGHRVRLVRRGPATSSISGVTWMHGDVTDRTFANRVCRGATTVYNCTNPPDYHRWEGVVEPLFRATWEAAGRAGARLVQLDNLYMVGRPEAAPFDEDAPMRPCSGKGRLRKQLVEELMRAHLRGDVEATWGRASDYFGPQTPNAAVLRPDVYRTLRRGGTIYVFGDPDMPHSYSYTPDVARGLAALGSHPAAVGRVWHLPVAAQLTTRGLLERFAAHAGTRIKVRRVPQWALRAAGAVVPMLSALAEMTYQWDVPYLMDDGAFRRTFGLEPTPLPAAIEASLATARASKAA